MTKYAIRIWIFVRRRRICFSLLSSHSLRYHHLLSILFMKTKRVSLSVAYRWLSLYIVHISDSVNINFRWRPDAWWRRRRKKIHWILTTLTECIGRVNVWHHIRTHTRLSARIEAVCLTTAKSCILLLWVAFEFHTLQPSDVMNEMKWKRIHSSFSRRCCCCCRMCKMLKCQAYEWLNIMNYSEQCHAVLCQPLCIQPYIFRLSFLFCIELNSVFFRNDRRRNNNNYYY